MLSSQAKIKIFCDFDGTISPVDIGNRFYREFGDIEKCDDIVRSWRNGEITSSQCLSGECATIKDITYEKFDAFLTQFNIDDYFNSFMEFCSENGIDVYVLSDGVDYYINSLFNKAGINVPFYSNSIILKDNGGAEMIYPYSDNVCDNCANCKRNQVINNSSDDDITIYIGDGKSDFCPVEYCDFIFAKKELKKNCEIKNIPFYPFSNFAEVLLILKSLLNKKRIKTRNQAKMKRRELYMVEA